MTWALSHPLSLSADDVYSVFMFPSEWLPSNTIATIEYLKPGQICLASGDEFIISDGKCFMISGQLLSVSIWQMIIAQN